MKKQTIRSIGAVTHNRICSGCGACVVICPISCIRFEYGQRYNFPVVDSSKCLDCGKCLKVCPSAFLLNGIDPGFSDEPAKESYSCFLVHTKEDRIRLDAASGGFITGMILQLLQKGLINGAIVASCEGENPLVAESFIAMDRASILRACGSKYTPVSSCTVLLKVIEIPGRYVFVGTPCMVEGLARLQKLLPIIGERVVLSISFTCAGMASRLATKSYIENDGGLNVKNIRRVAYRGNGWPGRFRVFGDNDDLLMDRPLIGGSLTHVVGRDHYLRCDNCLDHWAHCSDIVVSDPWTEEMIQNETKGRSAVMVRTERGQQAVDLAINSNEFVVDRISADQMVSYNRHLVIDLRHARHCWMAVYQLVFFKRIRYLLPLLRYLKKNKIIGLRTTLKARLNKKYYY